MRAKSQRCRILPRAVQPTETVGRLHWTCSTQDGSDSNLSTRGGWRSCPALRYELSGRCFQTRAKRWPPAQLPGQSFNRAEGGGTDVVFHSLNVMIDDALVETEELEKIGQKFVPVRNVTRERFASRG